MTHTINSNSTVAVAVDYYWLPINAEATGAIANQESACG